MGYFSADVIGRPPPPPPTWLVQAQNKAKTKRGAPKQRAPLQAVKQLPSKASGLGLLEELYIIDGAIENPAAAEPRRRLQPSDEYNAGEQALAVPEAAAALAAEVPHSPPRQVPGSPEQNLPIQSALNVSAKEAELDKAMPVCEMEPLGELKPSSRSRDPPKATAIAAAGAVPGTVQKTASANGPSVGAEAQDAPVAAPEPAIAEADAYDFDATAEYCTADKMEQAPVMKPRKRLAAKASTARKPKSRRKGPIALTHAQAEQAAPTPKPAETAQPSAGLDSVAAQQLSGSGIAVERSGTLCESGPQWHAIREADAPEEELADAETPYLTAPDMSTPAAAVSGHMTAPQTSGHTTGGQSASQGVAPGQVASVDGPDVGAQQQLRCAPGGAEARPSPDVSMMPDAGHALTQVADFVDGLPSEESPDAHGCAAAGPSANKRAGERRVSFAAASTPTAAAEAAGGAVRSSTRCRRRPSPAGVDTPIAAPAAGGALRMSTRSNDGPSLAGASTPAAAEAAVHASGMATRARCKLEPEAAMGQQQEQPQQKPAFKRRKAAAEPVAMAADAARVACSPQTPSWAGPGAFESIVKTRRQAKLEEAQLAPAVAGNASADQETSSPSTDWGSWHVEEGKLKKSCGKFQCRAKQPEPQKRKASRRLPHQCEAKGTENEAPTPHKMCRNRTPSWKLRETED